MERTTSKTTNYQSNNNSNDDATVVISVQEYRRIKRKLIKDEKVNFDHITAIPCSGNSNWYEIAEHSALIYYNEVCEKLQLPTKFHADVSSHYLKYEIGYIRSKGVDYIRSKLKAAHLYQSETVQNHIYTFKLTTDYSVDTLKKFRTHEINRRNRNNDQLPSYNIDPNLYQLITSTGVRLHRITKPNQNRPSIKPHDTIILTHVRQLLKNYYRLCFVKNADSPDYINILKNMRTESYELITAIRMLYDFKLWPSDLVANVSAPIFQIKNIIEHKIKQATHKEKSQ